MGTCTDIFKLDSFFSRKFQFLLVQLFTFFFTGRNILKYFRTVKSFPFKCVTKLHANGDKKFLNSCFKIVTNIFLTVNSCFRNFFGTKVVNFE